MNLFSDDPIQSAHEDQLQRQAFAEQVAQVCRRVHEQGASSVIALIGPWGSGKTSVLNMVRLILSKDSDWLVGEYNPWLLSDTETLLREFFIELRSLLPAEYQTGKLRDAVRHYANAVSPVAAALGLLGINVPDHFKQLVEDMLRGDTSLSKRKRELEEALQTADRPILLILDDLDRLEPTELMLVFKLVRLVGRLPNVYYLLSYDEATLLDVVAQTDLARGNRERAHNYLEKIVQLRLDLPPLHERQQLRLVNAALDGVADKYQIVLADTDQRMLSEVYAGVLKYYLDEPRAINRYFAQVDALYPLVGGEVNFADFTLITFLRTEFPAVYKLVQARRDELVNKLSFEVALREREALKDKKARWVKYLEDVKCADPSRLLTLLGRLFLPIKSALQGSNYGSGFYDELRRGKHIGSPDYFDRYFQLGLPEGDISDQALVRHLNELTSTDAATAHEAAAWLKATLLEDPALFVAKVRTCVDGPDCPGGPLLEVLAGSYISLPERLGAFDSDPQFLVIGLSRRLLASLPEPERRSVATSTLRSLSGLRLFADLVESSLPDREIVEPDVLDMNRKIHSLTAEVTAALKRHLDKLAKRLLVDADDNDVILFYRLSKLAASDMPDITWRFVRESHWPLADVVAWLVPVYTVWGGTAKRVIGEFSPALLDQLFGLDKLLNELREELNEPIPETINKEDPTLDIKRAYALRTLRGIRDSRQASKDTIPEVP